MKPTCLLLLVAAATTVLSAQSKTIRPVTDELLRNPPAEDWLRNFQPDPGTVSHVAVPVGPGLRVDTRREEA